MPLQSNTYRAASTSLSNWIARRSALTTEEVFALICDLVIPKTAIAKTNYQRSQLRGLIPQSLVAARRYTCKDRNQRALHFEQVFVKWIQLEVAISCGSPAQTAQLPSIGTATPMESATEIWYSMGAHFPTNWLTIIADFARRLKNHALAERVIDIATLNPVEADVHIPLDADNDSGTKAITIPGGCR